MRRKLFIIGGTLLGIVVIYFLFLFIFGVFSDTPPLPQPD